MLYSIEMNYRQFADSIDKLAIGLRGVTDVNASIGNSATTRDNDGREWSLFTFLDNGVSPHSILAKPGGVLANIQKGFGPVKSVQHPGQPAFNITSRVVAHVEQSLQNITYELHENDADSIAAVVIRRAIRDVLLDAKQFAESITPENWKSVHDGYETRINGRRFSK